MEEWTDKDGRVRNTLEVHATDMQFIGTRGDEPAAAAVASQSASSSAPRAAAKSTAMEEMEPDVSDDDIPF